jgi:hypothetical protein
MTVSNETTFHLRYCRINLPIGESKASPEAKRVSGLLSFGCGNKADIKAT